MTLKALFQHRGAFAGFCILIFVLLLATAGRSLIPYSSTEMDFVNVMLPPSLAHPFGTDSMGRDVLVRVLVGM